MNRRAIERKLRKVLRARDKLANATVVLELAEEELAEAILQAKSQREKEISNEAERSS